MNRLFASTIAMSMLATGGLCFAEPQADLALDRNRMFFRYTTSALDTGDFQVIPGNIYNPIVLPCSDVVSFGGQYDVDYLGAGAEVHPVVTFTFFTGGTQLANQNGYLSRMQPLGPISPGQALPQGFVVLKSNAQFFEFKPSDLPADTMVVMRMQLTATDASDPDLSNNERDIYLRRECR